MRLLNRGVAAAFLISLVAPVVFAQGTPPERLLRMSEYGLPSSDLDVHIALSENDDLAFYATPRSGSLRVVIAGAARTGLRTLPPPPPGFSGVGASAGNGFTGVFERGSGAGESQFRSVNSSDGSIITIFGNNFVPNGRFVATPRFSDSSAPDVTSIVRTLENGAASTGLYRSAASGGNIITIVGRLEDRGISDPRDYDCDGQTDLDARTLIRATGTYSDGTTAPSMFLASNVDGTIITIRGQDFGLSAFRAVQGASLGRDANGDVLAVGTVIDGGGAAALVTTRVSATTNLVDFSVLPLPAISADRLYRPGLSHWGNATFAATLADGSTDEIFVTNAERTSFRPLIGVGDALDGSSISRLVFDPQGFASDGDLAFYAELADGTAGLYLISTVPAPASGLVFAGCILGLRRRRS